MAKDMTWAKFQLALLEEPVKEKISMSTCATANSLVHELNNLDIEPASVGKFEEGICFTFCNGCQKLYMELYNDGALGYIIEDKSLCKAVENEDLENLTAVVDKIKSFVFKQQKDISKEWAKVDRFIDNAVKDATAMTPEALSEEIKNEQQKIMDRKYKHQNWTKNR